MKVTSIPYRQHCIAHLVLGAFTVASAQSMPSPVEPSLATVQTQAQAEAATQRKRAEKAERELEQVKAARSTADAQAASDRRAQKRADAEITQLKDESQKLRSQLGAAKAQVLPSFRSPIDGIYEEPNGVRIVVRSFDGGATLRITSDHSKSKNPNEHGHDYVGFGVLDNTPGSSRIIATVKYPREDKLYGTGSGYCEGQLLSAVSVTPSDACLTLTCAWVVKPFEFSSKFNGAKYCKIE